MGRVGALKKSLLFFVFTCCLQGFIPCQLVSSDVRFAMNKYLHQAIEKNKENGYLRYHAPRYDTLLCLLHKYYNGTKKILDIGRSPFTEIAYSSLKTQIDTLGFEVDKETKTGLNYYFDLNKSQNPKNWRRDIPQYDIIVFAEVIEHLHTSPKLVLQFLNSILKENGIIILQTPNAVVLHKRIQMLLGQNPFSLISENNANPAHFREYTASEISNYCRQAGFAIKRMSFENYFDYRYTNHAYGDYSERKIYNSSFAPLKRRKTS